ncbi:ATP cone domain-containing protein [Candidatus Vondammii sp. HM_W22]|uniref:ATP cone domain-containing protein n=1 Tax=Candidatus Vondammii sp. HM_W22 TaxID=2687299 RepID=UPI00403DDE1C
MEEPCLQKHQLLPAAKLPLSVIKRDGLQAHFDAEKIVSAIKHAGLASDEFTEEEAQLLAAQVLKVLRHRYAVSTPEIEQIQDVVEQVLITSNHHRTARATSVYREQHGKLRRDSSSLVDVESSMNEYLERLDWRVNANQGYSLGGLILNTAGKVTANYWLNHVYPTEVGLGPPRRRSPYPRSRYASRLLRRLVATHFVDRGPQWRAGQGLGSSTQTIFQCPGANGQFPWCPAE